MDHADILKSSVKAIVHRRESYGPPAEGLERAAVIASAVLDKPVTAFDVATILHSVKLARIAVSPKHLDSYVDAAAYLSFAGEFAGAELETPSRDPASPATS